MTESINHAKNISRRPLKKAPDDPDNQINDHTDEYEGNNRKIKFEVLSFYPNVTRQPAQKMKLVAKEVKNNSKAYYY